MEKEKLIIKGAREHNLKNISLELPRNKLVVITGLSGSGKSSLAFDTIYAEGQRRYVEAKKFYLFILYANTTTTTAVKSMRLTILNTRQTMS